MKLQGERIKAKEGNEDELTTILDCWTGKKKLNLQDR
jgi:hypothetical protein